MSTVEVQSFEAVTVLINEFAKYKNIFLPVFLQYNGTNQIITLQYTLRTFRDHPNRAEFLLEFIEQFLKNPIQIYSDLYKIEINDQNNFENLADDPFFCSHLGKFILINLENLLEVDSDTINIYIHSKYKLNLESVIQAHISKQPIEIEKFKTRYQLMCMLQNNDFPSNFRCLNIPVSFKLVLNDFINYFIPKKMLLARAKWYNEELKISPHSRKKGEYARMIRNKYGITPLEFGNRLDQTLNDILSYIQTNYSEIIEINNEIGNLIPEIPRGYHLLDKTGIIIMELNFLTNFNQSNCGVKSELIFDFKWMRNIFSKYFKPNRR